jgi:gluconate 2-dehydrogenase subunit 3-like protein
MNRTSETNFDRRQALRYTLGMMAAVGADPELVDAWMQQVHQESERSNPAPAGKKYRPLAEGKPAFFNAGEYKTLTRMVDLIIPRTETPGAADAGVPLYIDIVVNSDRALGEKFRAGLNQLDAASQKAGKKNFVDAPERKQIKVLESMLPNRAPGNDFFETVKAMTVVGYYSSEMGLFQELHFKGNEALSSFPGCPHGGHALDVPARKRPGVASIQDSTRKWPFPSSDNITGEDL